MGQQVTGCSRRQQGASRPDGAALARATGAAYHVNAADPVAFDRVPVKDGDVIEVSPALRSGCWPHPGTPSRAILLDVREPYEWQAGPAPPEPASGVRQVGIARGRLQEQGGGQSPCLADGQAGPGAGVAV
jgi:hypothetical protein